MTPLQAQIEAYIARAGDATLRELVILTGARRVEMIRRALARSERVRWDGSVWRVG